MPLFCYVHTISNQGSVLSYHTSTTHCSCLLDCLCEHTQCIMKWTVCFIKDLLCSSPDYNGACLIKFTARKMQQLQQTKSRVIHKIGLSFDCMHSLVSLGCGNRRYPRYYSGCTWIRDGKQDIARAQTNKWMYFPATQIKTRLCTGLESGKYWKARTMGDDKIRWYQ